MTTESIRLLLVDDHTSSRSALALLLDRHPHLSVVAEAGSVAEAKTAIAQTPVDVALIDFHLPDGSGEEVIAALRSAHPSAMAIALTGDNTSRTRALAVAAGAVGVLHKSADVPTITSAIEAAHAGTPLISRIEAEELLALAGRYQRQDQAALTALQSLTPREREVLQYLAEGLDNKAIAHRLNVGVETVRTHVVRILHKLEVNSRLQAVVLAIRHHFLDMDTLGEF